MKYLVFSYNDHDNDWCFCGLQDDYEAAVKHACKIDWPDSPTDLHFTPMPENGLLTGCFHAWSGQDHYYIMPVSDKSE